MIPAIEIGKKPKLNNNMLNNNKGNIKIEKENAGNIPARIIQEIINEAIAVLLYIAI